VAIDSKEKRQAIFSVGRVWNRNTFPIATPDEQWRLSVGNAYGGNALSGGGGGFVAAWARFTTLVAGPAGMGPTNHA